MLSHYLIVALRNFRRNPFVALLNVATLALGLFGFVTACGVVAFWDRADQHFENADRTLVVTSGWRVVDVDEGTEFASSTLPRTTPWLAQYLREDYPALEAVTRVVRLDRLDRGLPVSAGERASTLRAFAADGELLEIFDLPFIAGDGRSALERPRSVVLTREAATTLYGEENVLGRPIVLAGRFEGTVTGVLDEIPEPSHMGRSAGAPLAFDLLASHDFFSDLVREERGEGAPPPPEDWFGQSHTTYVLLPADGSLTAEALRRELPGFAERHIPSDPVHRSADIRFNVVPVGDLLRLGMEEALFRQETGVSIATALLALGALVLAVACVNFANLATARSVLRSREVGLRKAIGAKTSHVAAQHLLEAGLSTAAGLGVALALTAWLAPVVDEVAGIDLGAALFSGLSSWAFLASTLAAVTLVAGAYPAFVLTRVSPLAALRLGQPRGGPRRLAMLLVGGQFTVAAFLMIAVTVVMLQNRNLERTGLGLSADPLLVVENQTEITGIAQSTLRDQLARLPQISGQTALEFPPWTIQSGVMPLAASPDATDIERTALLHIVGEDFFAAFDVELIAGRAFDPRRAEDVATVGRRPVDTQNVVITRRLAGEFGFASPNDAVEKMLYIPASNPARPFRIIGVAEDKPLLVASGYGPRPSAYLFYPDLPFHVVRLPSDDVAGGLAAVEALWLRLAPDVAPNLRFADEYFGDVYRNFARVSEAFAALTAIALAISATGLFAIAILVASRRVHEIGVRKTLGARTADMLLMLLRGFAKPVLVANLVAWPLAYFAARAYLDVFIDPIELTLAPFALCLAATAGVAWLAVGGQTLRAARMTPARVLRQE